MTNTEIKELLVKMFASDFDIEKHIDLDGDTQQSFDFQTGFEFKTKNKDGVEQWHDAYISVCGTSYIKQGQDDFHDPIGDGRSENQGEPNSIDTFEFNEIECFVDGGNAPFSVTFDDLNKSSEEDA